MSRLCLLRELLPAAHLVRATRSTLQSHSSFTFFPFFKTLVYQKERRLTATALPQLLLKTTTLAVVEVGYPLQRGRMLSPEA